MTHVGSFLAAHLFGGHRRLPLVWKPTSGMGLLQEREKNPLLQSVPSPSEEPRDHSPAP